MSIKQTPIPTTSLKTQPTYFFKHLTYQMYPVDDDLLHSYQPCESNHSAYGAFQITLPDVKGRGGFSFLSDFVNGIPSC